MNKLVGKSLEIEQLLTPGPASALVGMWAAPESAEKSMGVLGDGPDLFIMLNAEKLVFFALPLESKERCFQKVLIVLISLLIWGGENGIRFITNCGKIPATSFHAPFSSTLHYPVLSFKVPFKIEMEFLNVPSAGQLTCVILGYLLLRFCFWLLG